MPRPQTFRWKMSAAPMSLPWKRYSVFDWRIIADDDGNPVRPSRQAGSSQDRRSSTRAARASSQVEATPPVGGWGELERSRYYEETPLM